MQKFECSSCSHDVYEGQKFCENCGKEVETELLICPNCDKRHFPNVKFCTSCGTNMLRKHVSFFTKILRVLFLILIVGLIVNIALKTGVNSPSINDRINNIVSKDEIPEEKNSSSEAFKIKYKELSFDTLIFSRETTHEVEIEVEGPTNQVFMKEAVKKFIIDTKNRVENKDIIQIKVYESIPEEGKSIYRAHFILVDLEQNEKYSLPSGYQNISDKMYAKWNINEKNNDKDGKWFLF